MCLDYVINSRQQHFQGISLVLYQVGLSKAKLLNYVHKTTFYLIEDEYAKEKNDNRKQSAVAQ